MQVCLISNSIQLENVESRCRQHKARRFMYQGTDSARLGDGCIKVWIAQGQRLDVPSQDSTKLEDCKEVELVLGQKTKKCIKEKLILGQMDVQKYNQHKYRRVYQGIIKVDLSGRQIHRNSLGHFLRQIYQILQYQHKATRQEILPLAPLAVSTEDCVKI